MSRMDEYLMAIITGENEDLPEPRSSTEREFYEAAKNGFGGGGASSWNDLTEKPFYEESTVIGDAITWDGNTDGLDSVMGMAYRVSGAVPTLEALQNGGTVTMFTPDGEVSLEFIADMVMDAEMFGMGTNLVMVQTDMGGIFIATEDGATFTQGNTSIVFDKAGIYFMAADGAYVSSFTINGYTFTETIIETIDNKFLEPFEMVNVGTDTFTWDGNTDGLYKPLPSETTTLEIYHVSDVVLTREELLKGGTVISSFGVEELNESTVGNVNNGAIRVGTFMIVATEENAVYSSVTLEKPGIYFYKTDGAQTMSVTISGYTGFPKKQAKLKKECLPSSGSVNTTFTIESATVGNINSATVTCDKDALTLASLPLDELYNV